MVLVIVPIAMIDRISIFGEKGIDKPHLLRKSTMALLCGDISLGPFPLKVTYLTLGVGPLAELVSTVHLSFEN